MTLDPPANNTPVAALPPGMTLDSTPAPPPAATPPAQPGMLSRAWDWVNKGLVSGKDLLNAAANAEAVQSQTLAGQPVESVDMYDQAKKYATSAPTTEESQSPIATGIKKGIAGATTDTADTASSFTSPASIALAGTGAIGKGVQAGTKVAKAVRAVQGAAGAGYAAQGAKQVYDAAAQDKDENGNPIPVADRVQRGLIGSAMASGGAAGVGDAVRSPRGMLSKKMAEPIDPAATVPAPQEATPGSNAEAQGAVKAGSTKAAASPSPTRSDLNQTAREHGVNLDLADATGSKVAKVAKAVTQHGLGGSGTFEAANEGNVGALNGWGNKYLDDLSTHSGEAAGSRIQKALQTDLDAKKSAATSEFQDLDKRVGPNSIDGTKSVEAEAQKIISENKDYYDKHPELVPKQAWSIIKNLAERPKVPVQQQVPGAGFAASPSNVTKMVPGPNHAFSWSELHQLRSDLMDVYRNNPDITKSKADAWLQQMVKTVDDTMTNASSGLSPADKAQFRQANDLWQNDIKGTYDNPQHPFYHALRTPFSSSSTQMMAAKAPELARQINEVLGPNAGDFQRAVVEKIMGRDQNGAINFQGMPNRLKQYSPEYLRSLLGSESTSELYKMSRIGQTVTKDINPSGSGKLIQKAGEAGAIGSGVVAAAMGHALPLVGAVAVPAAEKGIASGMNSPKVVDFLTKRGANQKPPRMAPGAISSAMAAQQQRR